MRIGISALAMTDEQSAARAGVARYCWALIDSLIKLDSTHEFVVAHGHWFQPPGQWTSRPNWKFNRAKGAFKDTKTFWDTFSAGRFISQHKLDVWLSTAHAVPIFCSVPCALTVHDLLVFDFRKHFSRRHRVVIGWAMRRSIKRANRILAVSEYTKSRVQKRFRISEDRITVTPLGPGNLVQRQEANQGDLLGLGIIWPKYLLTLGTLEPRKNLRRLIEAFAKTANEPEAKGLGLAIAGGWGWMNSELPALTRNLGIQDRVAFLGYVPDAELPGLFANCEAFVFPSLAEGFGLPVLEAMQLGAPVVCSNSTSIPEVGGDAVTYFDPTDTDAMAGAILSVLKTPEQRPARIRKGLLQAAKFKWEDCAKLTLEALERTARQR